MNFGAIKVQADYTFMGNIQAYIAYVNSIIAQNQAIFNANNGKVGGALNEAYFNQLSFNGSLLLDIPEQGTNRFITVIVYADGEQIWASDVTSQDPIRLPAAKKGYVYEIRISGNTPVRMVAMASSIGELRQIAQ
jgi:hypothetical protein